ncbi:MAG: ankyrin repeat domain-containing protein [Elusimicrobia bacterium]|nr:ankyrin repeat domain-containing protein [Elusimicrobiota bacterium]
MFRKENFYKYFTLICALAFLGACGKKEENKQVEEAPKVCTNTCKTWEVRTDFPECKCQLPEYKLPDAKLQAELINAALRGDLAFIKKQIDENHINPDSYLGLQEMENLLAFRESLSKNKFLYKNIKRTTDDLTMAYLAASNKNNGIHVLQLLLERGANFNKPSIKGQLPLEAALANNNIKALPLLLENSTNANIFSGEQNYLAEAVERNDADTTKALIEYAGKNGIDISSYLPPLENAIKSKKKDIITLLIDVTKADPNQTDSKGNPVLSDAALTGNKEIVTMLLLSGATVDQLNVKGQTPLMTLIEQSGNNYGNMNDMAMFLIDNGADVNATDLKGETPIFYAVRAKNEQLIKSLIAKGGDINARNNKGESVLFYTAENDDRKMTKFLLDNGASARLKNRKKLDAATLAVQMGFMETYDIIESYK